MHESPQISLGLKENLPQFILLVVVNFLVGGMIGLERTIIPELGSSIFNIDGKSLLLIFIAVFGVSKAITNYLSGPLFDKFGRKNILILGWILGFSVPFILGFTQSWIMILAANVILGVHQGLSWSSTVIMKIDLVGSKNRGFAIGINESAGYIAVGVTAYLTGLIAETYGLQPYPFYLGIAFSIIALILSIFFIKDTSGHIKKESSTSSQPLLTGLFKQVSWKNPNLGAVTQAGMVNNLNDGMIWGLLPLVLSTKGFDLIDIGKLVAIYPIVWGVGQLIAGKLIDIMPSKILLVSGMFLQSISIIAFVWATSFAEYAIISAALGIGTALVYPTFIAAISSKIHPTQRAKGIGVFRLWRDLGYAFGAISTGIIADILGIEESVIFIGLLTGISGFILVVRYR